MATVRVTLIVVRGGCSRAVTFFPLPTSLLLPLPFLPFLFLLLFLRRLDTVALLHFAQTQGIGHEGLIGGSFLLFDGQQRVLADLGCDIARCIRFLNGNEVFMRSTNLKTTGERVQSRAQWKRTDLLVLACNQNFVDALLT
jgi:hypothetical protein